MKKSSTAYLILMSTGAMLFSGTAVAQQQSDESGTVEGSQNVNGDDQNVIIVTARGREENLQSVPLAITALTAEDLESKSIDNLEDVARFTPGFSFETLEGSSGGPVIRGLTQIASFNREQTTAVFYDNIYLPRSFLFDSTTDGLARVEIVKGPQSSRFGRNAFAGAINYIPKKASLDGFSAEGAVTYGSDERFDIGGNINVVVIPDILAVFGSYYHTEFDGSWENTHPFADFGFRPGTVGNAGGRNNESYTGGFIFRPGEGVTIEFSQFHGEIRDEALATDYRVVNNGFGNCGPLGPNGLNRLFCGTLPTPEDTVVVEPRGFGRQVDVDISRAKLQVELSDSLDFSYLFGKISASSITAFQSEDDPIACGTTLPPFIFGGTKVCNFQASPLGSLDYDSHELRLAFDNDGPFSFAVGAYYQEGLDNNFFVSKSVPALDLNDLSSATPLVINKVNSGPPVGFPFDPAQFANLVVRVEDTKTKVYAGFAEVTGTFNDGRTRVSAEGRYTSEKIGTINLLNGLPVANSPQTFKFFTPRFTAEHDLTPDSMVYATVARGAKAGGFNSGAFDPAVAGSYEPEFNWTYEIGIKNRLFNRLTLNAAAFFTDWSNQQLTVPDPTNPNGVGRQGITQNTGNARVFGIELDAVFEVTDGLTVDGNFAYINSKFAQGAFDQSAALQGIDGDLSGKFLPRSPEVMAALGVQYDGEINEDTSFFIRADGSYQSSQFADPINNVSAPGRTIFNARSGIDFKMFSLDVWAKNILDKRYIAAANFIFQTPPNNNILGAIYGERRTIGVTARFKY